MGYKPLILDFCHRSRYHSHLTLLFQSSLEIIHYARRSYLLFRSSLPYRFDIDVDVQIPAGSYLLLQNLFTKRCLT